MEEHNGQFFTELTEVSEMCGQAEIIAYYSVSYCLGGKTAPDYKLKSFAFNFSLSSMTNLLYCLVTFQFMCSFQITLHKL